MKTLDTYTSTGLKLLHHPRAVEKFMTARIGTPISLQLAPTSVCNLKCKFCSNVNRKSHEELDVRMIYYLVSSLKGFGLKTVEWTGGGDPTMYPRINGLIEFCSIMNLEQGFITNGVLLKDKVSARSISRLKWLRISMNCLDYVDKVDLPKIPPTCTLGFSYVYNTMTTPQVLMNLREHVRKYDPSYVRVVPNCQCTAEEQIKNNKVLSEMVSKWGPPYFYQPKEFERPAACYWCYFKPFVLHDGYAYPCSSVVLNSNSERSFHEKFRWKSIGDLPDTYRRKMESFKTGNCDHCVFTPQNKLLIDLLQRGRMENFV